MRKGIVTFLLVAVVSLVVYAAETLDVYFIDVGAGDAILIDCGDWEALLDAGSGHSEMREAVLTTLSEHVDDGIIELAILSRSHADNYGGFGAVLARYEVWEFWRSFDTEPDTTGTTYSSFLGSLAAEGILPVLLERGDRFVTGLLEWVVLGPGELSTGADNDNENSLVLLLTYGNVRFLFVGDIESNGEASLLDIELPEGQLVLKTAHPEFDASMSVEFLTWADPELAVISTDDVNPPASAGLSLLGIPSYITSDVGTIHVSTDGEFVWVATSP